MDFASSTRAAINRKRHKGIVTNSSVVPRRPFKVMGQNRIDYNTVKCDERTDRQTDGHTGTNINAL